MNQSLIFRNVRFLVLFCSFILSLGVYIYVMQIVPAVGQLRVIKLEQIYALVSVALLYFTMLAGPLCFVVNNLPGKVLYLRSRRALGVSSFYFALLHVCIAFFFQLGGLNGIGFLTQRYIVVLLLGLVALAILALLTFTSFDWVVSKLGFSRWKLLHRLSYVAGILVFIHTIMLGSHFSDLTGNVSVVTFFALSFLLMLEAPRVDKSFSKLFALPQFGMSSVALACVLSVVFIVYIRPIDLEDGQIRTFDIHAEHKKLAKEAQGINSAGNNIERTISPLGDSSKRYTVSFNPPSTIVSNTQARLEFKVTDASNGSDVKLFRLLYTKPMHLIVVDQTLSYFTHIHPEFKDGVFSISTSFPKPGRYHLYTNFHPMEGIEQQFAFSLTVTAKETKGEEFVSQPENRATTKEFGVYRVTVETKAQLQAKLMSLGEQVISFRIHDAKTDTGITTLEPYLGSFGHLTMVNTKTFEYIHVHPASQNEPAANERSGPVVDFLPVGIYGAFKPGTYKAFAEFNPNGEVFVSDFILEIQ